MRTSHSSDIGNNMQPGGFSSKKKSCSSIVNTIGRTYLFNEEIDKHAFPKTAIKIMVDPI